jgi:predicted branched-subunit amino acid permease
LPDGATRATSFRYALRHALAVQSLVLYASALGYGAFARACGLSFGQAMALPLMLHAAPAQVVLADHAARGATLAAAALAVTLTAVRLMPMTVVLMPLLKGHGGPRWHELVAVHFVGVTQWLEGLRRLPQVPERLRLAYYLGIGCGISAGTLSASAAGYLLAASVPPTIAAALLFITPLSFLLSLIEAARSAVDRIAIVGGVVVGPLAFLAAPGLDLLLTGLLVGTAAFAIDRSRR